MNGAVISKAGGSRYGDSSSYIDVVNGEGYASILAKPLVYSFTCDTVEFEIGGTIDDISAKLYNAEDSYTGTEEIFPDGYIQIAER